MTKLRHVCVTKLYIVWISKQFLCSSRAAYIRESVLEQLCHADAELQEAMAKELAWEQEKAKLTVPSAFSM